MPKEVTLLTGFLGAGKTTFLNAVIAENRDVKYAIIENEIGKEAIDNELIINADDSSIMTMKDGCLCCSLNDDLYNILEKLFERKDHFDHLIIESTGIADPAGVALPFLTHPGVKRDYNIQRVICLVDPTTIQDRLQDTDEALKQIAFSDVILVNKSDLVSEKTLDEIVVMLKLINPWALLFVGNKDNFPIYEIMQSQRIFITESISLDDEKNSDHRHSKHEDITTLSFKFSEPFDIQVLYQRLVQFLMFQARDVFRIKGVIYTEEADYKLILQSVGQNLSVTGGKKWSSEDTKQSRIVFIGRRLNPKGFEDMLRKCLLKSPKIFQEQ
ncbi:MAG: GTP-binding protein [Saprospiraceae bacterium]|nr:GTP-binding protein [Saprospiraceae bacterium]